MRPWKSVIIANNLEEGVSQSKHSLCTVAILFQNLTLYHLQQWEVLDYADGIWRFRTCTLFRWWWENSDLNHFFVRAITNYLIQFTVTATSVDFILVGQDVTAAIDLLGYTLIKGSLLIDQLLLSAVFIHLQPRHITEYMICQRSDTCYALLHNLITLSLPPRCSPLVKLSRLRASEDTTDSLKAYNQIINLPRTRPGWVLTWNKGM